MCDNKVRNFFDQSASVHRIFTGMLLTCQASAASWFIHVIKDHGHVLSFLCDNACKRFLAGIYKRATMFRQLLSLGARVDFIS